MSPELRLHTEPDAGEGRPIEPAPVLLVAPLLTAAEVAAIVGVTPKRVYELGIPAVRISERSLRWRPAAVSSWIQSHEESR
jgi:predicted DNA-binding transcriptional regulator AlpA